MQINPFDVEPAAQRGTEWGREDARGREKSATGFNEDLCQQNNTATLQTDPRRLSNIIHNLGIVHKWLLDFVVAVVIMLFRVLDENQTRATVQGDFLEEEQEAFIWQTVEFFHMFQTV